MRTDFSIHFTIKEQSIEQIEAALKQWNKQTGFLVSMYDAGNPVLHHCFLPREIIKQKGFSESVVDFLDSIEVSTVRWFSTTPNIKTSRELMIQNLDRVKGVALFIGEIKEGVKDEWDLVSVFDGIEKIHIPIS